MATYYWVGSNIDDAGNTPNVPYNSWQNANNWTNSPGGPRGFVPAAGDTVFIDGGTFTGSGQAGALTVSGRYTDPTQQLGGMALIAATLTDQTATIDAISAGVGLDKGSTWTNSAGLDAEASVGLFDGSVITDQGSDSIGVSTTNTVQLSVDGVGSEYSDTGGTEDDALIIATNGGGIFVGGALTGTGDITVGGPNVGSSPASATLGAVTLNGISVTDNSILTAGNVTTNSLQIIGGSTATIASLAVKSYLTLSGAGSELTDGGSLQLGGAAGHDTEIQVEAGASFSLAVGDLALGTAGDAADFRLDGRGSNFAFTGALTLGVDGSGEFQVANGASYATSSGVALGSGATGEGSIRVSGDGASLAIGGAITMAGHALNVVTVSEGTLTAASLVAAVDATGTLYDLVEAFAGGVIDVSGATTIGVAGLGTLEAQGGGTVEVGSLALATNGTGTLYVYPSAAIVTGSGSKLLVAQDATIGAALPLATNSAGQPNGTSGNWNYSDSGYALIDADSGGFVSVGGTLVVQTPKNGRGAAITVTDGGSFEVGGSSRAAANQLGVDAGGAIVGHGTIEVGPQTDDGSSSDTGTVTNNGMIEAHGGTLDIEGDVTGYAPISASTTTPTYSLTIDNKGTIEASNGTMVLDGNVSGDGQVLVGQNSTLEFGGAVADDVLAMFLPSGGATGGNATSGETGSGDAAIVIDDPRNFEGVISSENFEPGDAIDLPSVPYVDPGSGDVNPDGASFQFETGEDGQTYVLQIVENDQTYNIPINEDTPFTGSFKLSADGSGGTLATFMPDPGTDYSLPAVADGSPKAPYSGVVRILSKDTKNNQKSGYGTGFAVERHLVLTALHVVSNSEVLAPGNDIYIETPSGANEVGTVVKTAGPSGSIGVYPAVSQDWAYVYVPGVAFNNSQIFQFDRNFGRGEVNFTGYPGNLNVQTITVNGKTGSALTPEVAKGQSTISGPAVNLLNAVYLPLTYPPYVHGFSGSPIYTEQSNTFKVVGIITEALQAGNANPIAGIGLKGIPDPSDVYFNLLYKDPPANDARITSAVVAQTGDADTGQIVQFFVDMSDYVLITGSGPTLSLNDGGTATYDAADSTGTELIFDYTVGTGDQTANLEITQVNSDQAVQGPGGASIDFSVLDNLPTDLSNNSPLVVTSIASSNSGEVDAGQSVQLTLMLSEPVTVNTADGAPNLTLNDGSTATYDAAASNASTGTLVFDYTVGSGDETANLEVTSVNLPSGTAVQDAAGYHADFSAAINAPTGLQVGPAYVTAITPSQTIDLTTGQTVQLTLTMSQGVTVNTAAGSPTLSLSDGATATYDAVASNPSAGNLVFDDTVGSGDYTTDLQLLTYNPNEATVTDAHGVNADLSGATQFDLALDVNAATVTNLAVSPATGEADSGQTVTLTLTMSEPVTVNLTGGSPALSLNDGGTAAYDSAASNPSAGTLVFANTVGVGDETPSLQISQVILDGATIDDASGNAADLSAASNFTTSLQIGPAFVTSITPSLTGEIFTGQTDHLTLAMSQEVTVNTSGGSPMLSLSDGATATYDSAASDPSTGALVFDYTVGAGDYTAGLSVIGYNPGGATVTDASGVNADFSGVAGFDLGLDVNAATVTAVTASPSSGEADSGARITVTLTMSEAVTVDTAMGAPTLNLGIGANAIYDSAASDPSAGTLVFDDTVGAADETPDLQVIQVKLNGATIDDATGNAADLSAASSFDMGLQIGPAFVDQVTPSLSGDITTGQTVRLAVAMSAGLTIDAANGSPTLSLSDGATATYDSAGSDPSAGTLVFDYTVGDGDYASGLSVAGFIANGATITDANGISPDFSGLAQSYLGLDVNAATVTNVTASSASGDALSGQQVLLTLTTNEPLTVDVTGGSPKLDLSDGAIATFDSVASNPAAGALAFAYTVGATDEDPHLQIAMVNLNGAAINDPHGHAADLSAATTIATDLQIGLVPRVMAWTGSSGSAFTDASNWTDVTDSLAPAQTAPDLADTVEFNTSGGAVSGTATVAAVEVGSNGNGVLQLSAGATLAAGSFDAGVVATDVGQIGLTGAGTELMVTGSATVADDGTGVLSILAGATFAATNLTIGAQGDSSGALVVSGDGSVVQLSGALNIGTALGVGDLTVGPGAAVHASVVNLQGQVVLEGGLLDPTVQLINQGQTAGGFGTIAAGDIVDEGVIQAGGNKASQKLLLIVGTVLGGGTLTVNGTQPGSNPTGVLQINAGGTMELTAPVINAATMTFTDNLTPTGTYTVNNNVVDVTFADAAGVLKLDDIAGFAGTITTHQAGDSFVITGGTLSGLNVSNGNTLTFADSGAGAGVGGIDSIIFASPISAAGFDIVSGNTVQVACFAEGTLIETVNGPVAVEALLVGDRVVTAEDGGGEPVIWIGRRAVNCARHPNPMTVWPVRVRAGAFGPGQPARDLYLSPDHAVFVNEVLVPVKLLINGTSIAQVKRDPVMYFHVELPRHAVILAEGLPVESYFETGDRADFNHGGVIRLHSEFGRQLRPDMAMLWETKGAAPLVMTGPNLAVARQLIASIASRRNARSGTSVSRPG